MALLLSVSFVMRRRGGRSGGGSSPRGELYPALDLHGHKADEAVRRSRSWLSEQHRSGVRVVRLITGRGLHSAGPPVLRSEIEALLHSLKPELIADFSSSSAGGSFLVELQPPPRRTPPPRSPEVFADPALRREAEEALHELGVQPTPELVAAEIRRLRREKSDKPA